MRRSGLAGICALTALLAGCGSSAKTITRTVTKTTTAVETVAISHTSSVIYANAQGKCPAGTEAGNPPEGMRAECVKTSASTSTESASTLVCSNVLATVPDVGCKLAKAVVYKALPDLNTATQNNESDAIDVAIPLGTAGSALVRFSCSYNPSSELVSCFEPAYPANTVTYNFAG